MVTENINMLWAEMAIEEFCRLGCKMFCLAPGSRSTPLAVALARNSKAKTVICYDERSLGFFALGHGRATATPACVVVTSGTAVANLFPSVVEASLDNVPMLMISADRPGYLIDCGANQTIDQSKMFGNYVRWHAQITPTDSISGLRVLSTIDHAFYKTTHPNYGPVHLNWQFDEPLAPVHREVNDKALIGVDDWKRTNKVFTDNIDCSKQVDEEALAQLAYTLNHTERGLLLIGALKKERDKLALSNLAQALGWAVASDIGSGFHAAGVYSIAQLLDPHGDIDFQNLQVILQFGSRFVSKRLPQDIKSSRIKEHILVDASDSRLDPAHSVTKRICADIPHLIKKLVPMLKKHERSSDHDDEIDKQPKYNEFLASVIEKEEELSQCFIATTIADKLDEKFCVFIGNSLPIRSMDLVSHQLRTSWIAVNRGASGIDGNLSTACGYASALNKRLVVFVGDLTFLHDINGLNFLKYCSEPVTIIVANNRGGGIFSFLPIADYQSVFSPYFDSPHDFDLSSLSAGFGVKHIKITTKKEFSNSFQASLSTTNHIVIEAATSNHADLAIHKTLSKPARVGQEALS